MCNSANCNHTLDDLNDDIFDLLGNNQKETFVSSIPSFEEIANVFTETCPACKGTGNFRSYTGRIVGQCFKCKGQGNQTFKTSPEAREKARESAANRAAAKQAAIDTAKNEWVVANAEDYGWIIASANNFEFAGAMLTALQTYGTLTEKQHETVTRLRKNAAEKKAARQTETKEVNVSFVEDAFNTATENGISRPKLRLGDFRFSLAPATGRNAGSIYVKDIETDTYLGKITNGKFSRSYDCTTQQEADIVAVCSDPKEAAVAYGRRTGTCSCCGRELTNQESIDLGIGPICMEKYFG